MKKILALILALLIAFSGVVACYLITAPLPKISVENVEIKLGKDQAKMSLNVEIDNPLKIPIRYFKADYRVLAGDAQIVSGELSFSEKVSVGAKANVVLPIAIDMKRIRELKKKNEKLSLVVSGNLHFDLKFKKVAVPFSRKFETKGKALSIEVENIDISEISGKKVVLLINLGLKSALFKDLNGLQANYHAMIEGQSILEGKLALAKLPAMGRGTAQLPLTLNVSTLKRVKKENRGEKILLTIKGNVSALIDDKKIETPFFATKEIVLKEKPFQVKLRNLRIERLRAPSVFYLTLTVTNTTQLDVKELKISGTITIAKGLEVSVPGKKICLPAGQTHTVELKVKRERRSVAKLLRILLREKRCKSKWKLKFRGIIEEGTKISSQNVQSGDLIIDGK